MTDLTVPSLYETEAGLKALANYLRSPYGVKVRSAIEHEKRVDYFKGKRLVELLLEGKKMPKSLPKITDRAIAVMVAQKLIKSEYFHRSEKVDGKKGYLVYSQKNFFEEGGYYTWMYAGNMMWSNLATGAVIAIVIIFTLLPVWPEWAKKILWYISVTFLIITLVLVLIRFCLFVIMWLLGYEFWVFPRLFDESLSFVDSFKPIYTLEKGSPGQGYYRLALLGLIIAFVVWAVQQPTEFDGFLKAQKDFIDDLYSGNLLADVAHDSKNSIDRTIRKAPNLDDLMHEIEEDERMEKESRERELTELMGENIDAEAQEKIDSDMIDKLLNEDSEDGDDSVDETTNLSETSD